MGTVPHESPYPLAGAAVRHNARWAPLTALLDSDETQSESARRYTAAPPPADAWLQTRPILYRSIPSPPPEPVVAAVARPRRSPNPPKAGILGGLRRIIAGGREPDRAPLGYTPAACAAFAAGANDRLLERALVLFTEIADYTLIDSAALSSRLGIPSGRLRAQVTEPLERRAGALRLRRPFILGMSAPSGRRTWSDRDGVAAVLAEAMRVERDRRRNPGYMPVNEGGSEAA